MWLLFVLLLSIYTRELPTDEVIWIVANNHPLHGFLTTINHQLFKEHPVGLLNEYYAQNYRIVGHSISKDHHYSWTLHKMKP